MQLHLRFGYPAPLLLSVLKLVTALVRGRCAGPGPDTLHSTVAAVVAANASAPDRSAAVDDEAVACLAAAASRWTDGPGAHTDHAAVWAASALLLPNLAAVAGSGSVTLLRWLADTLAAGVALLPVPFTAAVSRHARQLLLTPCLARVVAACVEDEVARADDGGDVLAQWDAAADFVTHEADGVGVAAGVAGAAAAAAARASLPLTHALLRVAILEPLALASAAGCPSVRALALCIRVALGAQPRDGSVPAPVSSTTTPPLAKRPVVSALLARVVAVLEDVASGDVAAVSPASLRLSLLAVHALVTVVPWSLLGTVSQALRRVFAARHGLRSLPRSHWSSVRPLMRVCASLATVVPPCGPPTGSVRAVYDALNASPHASAAFWSTDDGALSLASLVHVATAALRSPDVGYVGSRVVLVPSVSAACLAAAYTVGGCALVACGFQYPGACPASDAGALPGGVHAQVV